MTTKIIVTGIIAVLFLVFAIVEERKTIDIKRLRIVMAVLMVVTAVFCTIPPLLGNDKNSILAAAGIFIAITFVGIIIANTWAKKK